MRRKPSFLIIDSSYPINTRNDKIICSLRDLFPFCKIDVVTWNRDLRDLRVSEVETHLYSVASAYGKPIEKLCNLSKYHTFIKNLNARLKPTVLIASHWDMLMLAASFKNKKQILIYENLDIPKSGNSLVLKGLRCIENWSLKRTDIVIFASRFFEPLYKQSNFDRLILENKPVDNTPYIPSNRENHNELIISYIGGVRYLSIMKNLVDAVKCINGVRLNIHGEGYQLEALIEYTGKNDRIHFTGRYEYDAIGKLYESSDVVWGVYPNEDYNVKFAISNKFHESLYYQVPCIYASKTKLGEMVDNNSIGFTVDPYSISDIANLFIRLRDNKQILDCAIEKSKEFIKTEKSWREEVASIKELINKRIIQQNI